jgi:hypothetical protein
MGARPRHDLIFSRLLTGAAQNVNAPVTLRNESVPLFPMNMQRLARTCAVAVIAACAAAPAEDAREQLIKYLNAIGRDRIAGRDRAIAQIQTRAAAETRKAQVREKILSLIGGLPGAHDPSVKQLGALPNDGFRIERIIYESLGFTSPPTSMFPPRAAGRFRRSC